jgi:hypothetical protein
LCTVRALVSGYAADFKASAEARRGEDRIDSEKKAPVEQTGAKRGFMTEQDVTRFVF